MTFFERLDISTIFKRHFETFYHYGNYQWHGERKVTKSDMLTFLLIPLSISIVIVALDPQMILKFTELIITSLSIFTGLLFSLLTLIFDLAKKQKESVNARKSEDKEEREEAIFTLIKELFVNIAYSIALSILAIILLLAFNFRPRPLILLLSQHNYLANIKSTYIYCMSSIITFLLIQFLFTLLMILSRFFIIFNKQVEA